LCDILVATPRATREGVTIFAKNSDREPNEAQVLEFIPRRRFEGEYVELTNTRFPSVRETYAVLIARPWWIYGAEMGVNEYGLAIGNVAVFTKEPYAEKGLLGMDMLRLALERTRTAREALKFLVELIEGVGQGGNYSYERRFRYHNSFILKPFPPRNNLCPRLVSYNPFFESFVDFPSTISNTIPTAKL